MPEREPAVEVLLQGVVKRYPGTDAPAVADLDLTVRRGELLVLLGPSGCGKSTTLRMINRLVEPTAGRIEVGGRDVRDLRPTELRRGIGYVIQAGGLLRHLTVADNIAVVPKLLGWSRSRIRSRVQELLELVGLDPDEFARRHPRELSGGQQQRVGVARALAGDPPVLLMDEPFGALDPVTRDHLQTELLRIQDRVRKTIVLVTHDIDEAVRLGDRIAVFGDGAALEQLGTPDEILSAPASPFVARFIGSGAALKRLRLGVVGDLPTMPAPTVVDGTNHYAEPAGQLVVDPDGRVLRWADGRPALTLRSDDTLHHGLDALLAADGRSLVLVDDHGRAVGLIDADELLVRIGVRRQEHGSADHPNRRGAAPATADVSGADVVARGPATTDGRS